MTAGTRNRTLILLLPGMWHAGWVWDEVREHLAAAGYDSRALTLPGPGRADGDPTFAGHCRVVRAELAAVARPVLLVGHSYSGALLSEVGDGPTVRAMVFVTAFALDVGESIAEVNDAEEGSRSAGDDLGRDGDHLVVGAATARAAFYGDCPAAVVDAAVDRLTPEYHDTRTTPMSRAAWRHVPAHYVVCTRDRAVLPSIQRRMAARCASSIELPSGHSPMLSMPDRLGKALVDAAAEVERAG